MSQNILEMKLKLAMDALESLSQKKASADQLKEQSEITSERSEGNYDDCFSDGQTQADAEAAIFVREKITEIDQVEQKLKVGFIKDNLK